MELEDLVGTHMLDGVDYGIVDDMANSRYDFTNVIRFRLDGIVYTATEDPDDGYRSSMRNLIVTEHHNNNKCLALIETAAKLPNFWHVVPDGTYRLGLPEEVFVVSHQ